MKLMYLCLSLLCAFIVVGCHHELTEKDLAGTWNKDPDPAAKVQNGMVLTLGEDKKFELKTPEDINVDGTWAYDLDSKKVGLTPLTLVVRGRSVPMSQAVQMIQQMTTNQQAIQGLQELSREEYLTPSEDGKKLADGNRPAFVKGGA